MKGSAMGYVPLLSRPLSPLILHRHLTLNCNTQYQTSIGTIVTPCLPEGSLLWHKLHSVLRLDLSSKRELGSRHAGLAIATRDDWPTRIAGGAQAWEPLPLDLREAQ